MEEEIILSMIGPNILMLFLLTACGIKGSPLPPNANENRLLDISALEVK